MKYNLIYLLCSCCLLLWGCSNDPSCEMPKENQQMQFRCFIKDGNTITPVSRAVETDIDVTGINLYCAYHLEDFRNDTTGPPEVTYDKIFWNTPVDANGVAKDGVPRFWMSSALAKYTFWAHSTNPKGTPEGWGVSEITGGGVTDHQNPVCYVNQLNEPMKQVDLLLADAVENVKATYIAPIIGLYFQHLFSKINIRFFNSQGTQLNDCKATVTYMTDAVKKGCAINVGSGYINMNGANYHGYHSGTHPLHEGLFSVSSTATTTDYAFQAGDMILISQQVYDGFISVSLSYTPEGTTGELTADVDIPAPLTNSGMLGKGNAYTYHINVIAETNALKIGGVTLSSWEGQNATIDWSNY